MFSPYLVVFVVLLCGVLAVPILGVARVVAAIFSGEVRKLVVAAPLVHVIWFVTSCLFIALLVKFLKDMISSYGSLI